MAADGETHDLPELITRDNALALLEEYNCPECGVLGVFSLFENIGNNGVGIRCDACDRSHPFRRMRIMWLRSNNKRRANDISAVTAECGSYCYGCGLGFGELESMRIGVQVHHTRPFAEHGETGRKIPLCADCHEAINLVQRMHRRTIKPEGPP